MSQSVWGLLAIGSLLLSACSDQAPTEAQAEAQAHSGAVVYWANCASCHEGAVAKAPHRDMLQLLPPAAILRIMDGGVMLQQGHTLSPEDRRTVAEFLSDRPFSEVRTAQQSPTPMR